MNICAVILAGGSGKRLWPISRMNHPKQFLAVDENLTMLQSTFSRLKDIDISSSLVICNEEHRFLASDQLINISEENKIILEPASKNTAPAIALAAFEKLNEDSLLLILSADQLIKNNLEFAKSIKQAVKHALKDKIVVFGINTEKAHTGYGYIKKGDSIEDGYYVDNFKEKPSIELAKEYHDSDEFFWNSGIFLLKASKYIYELKKHRPEIYKFTKDSFKNKTIDNNFIRIDEGAYNNCPGESIDYAVLENTNDAVMVEMNCGWNDIGSWSSLWEVLEKDTNNNVLKGDVVTHKTSNSYIRSDDELVVTIGLNDIAVVKTKDALLVASKNESETVKDVFNQLKKDNRQESIYQRETYRPWGKYDVLEEKPFYKVKKITVNSGAKLSLQRHKYRSEHWVVVSGQACVTKDDNTIILSENESTYIPVGTIHSLENKQKNPLELIEVQTGSYLGEDDIERFEDIYGRANEKQN